MIDLYSGTPGSGKSLRAAIAIKWALMMGRPVIANFDFAFQKIKHRKSEFKKINTWELKPSDLIEFSKSFFDGKRVKEDKILLVIDECQLIFNARDWGNKDRAAWLSFFTQHRKFGFHVILIAQYDQMIDKQIRALIEYEHIHRKLSNFGIRGKLLSLVFGGNAFVAVRVWYPLKTKVDSEIYHARRSIYGLYDTYTQLDKPPEVVKDKQKAKKEATVNPLGGHPEG